jgi:LL-diaminopimelate aminotransferase
VTEQPFELAQRLKSLPPYLFAKLDELKQAEIAKGVDVIALGVGDPDEPTPNNILEAMHRAVDRPANHQYPSYEGMLRFREAVAQWYQTRFGVAVDPAGEVLSLIGSKEGIGHIPLAFVNPGEVVLVPDPGYPVYEISTFLAGGEPYFMPLTKENKFLPDLQAIPKAIRERARLMFLNYPNNPTAATAPRAFFEEVVRFARDNGIIVCHDAAYTEIYFDGQRPISFLEVAGARDVGVEPVVQGLGKIKTNLDSGIFQAIQEAGIEAMTGDQSEVARMRALYQDRRNTLVAGLRGAGLRCDTPEATFYVWVDVPGGYTSASFSEFLLTQAGIAATPGNGFGQAGESYIRFALTVPRQRLSEAVDRIRKALSR